MLVYQRRGDTLEKLDLGGGVSEGDLASLEKAVMAAMREEADGKYLRLDGGIMTGDLIRASALDLGKPLDINLGIHALRIYDSSNMAILGVSCTQTPDGNIESQFWSHRDGSTWPALKVIQTPDNVAYATAPNPRENAYASDVDTLRASINRHPLKCNGGLQIHVGGANASDTAGLFQGRGLSEDKPFASLDAAYNFLIANCVGGGSVSIVLHDDLEVSGPLYLGSANFNSIIITGDSAQRKLTLNDFLRCNRGVVSISNIELAAGPDISCFFAADLTGYLIIGDNVKLTGSVSMAALVAYTGGTIRINTEPAGAVTGKRFSVSQGGRILTGGKGPNAIPGTAPGTCDDTSIYV